MFADIRQMVVNNAHGCTLSVCPHEAQAARPHYAVHTAAFDGQQGRSMVSLNAQQSASLAAVQVSSTIILTQLLPRGRLPYCCTVCCRACCFACDCTKAFSGGKYLQMVVPPAAYSCQHTNTGGFDGFPFRNHPISSRHCLLRGRTK